MSKSFDDITKHVSTNMAKLHKHIPETTKAFSQLGAAATADGVLDKKTKELIALALAVGARCDACIGFLLLSKLRKPCTNGFSFAHGKYAVIILLNTVLQEFLANSLHIIDSLFILLLQSFCSLFLLFKTYKNLSLDTV